MGSFMREHFPNIPFAVGHDFKGPRRDGKLKSISYAELLNRDAADVLLMQVKSSGLSATNSSGAKLKIDKPRTIN